jgi:DNA polymerase III epsilon subunit-like protein
MHEALTIQFSHVAALAKALDRPITIFDLEATTFRGRSNFGITEVACCSVTLQGNAAIYGHLIDPERAIDAKVSELTGITQAMVRGKETWAKRYAGHFRTLASDHWVGGFNIKTFDCPAVLEINDRYGLPIDEGFPRILDVRNLYLTLEKPESKKGTLVDIADFYGVQPQGELHRAKADVILTLETLDAMVKGYGPQAIIDALTPKATAPKKAVSAGGKRDSSAMLVEVASSGEVRTVKELADKLGVELRVAEFELSKAVDDGTVNPLPFVNEATLEWLRTMLGDLPTETLADGRLKPIYAYLSERQPEGMALDYLQLRIGLQDCGLRWSTLKVRN